MFSAHFIPKDDARIGTVLVVAAALLALVVGVLAG
jgi:hypothetical protein